MRMIADNPACILIGGTERIENLARAGDHVAREEYRNVTIANTLDEILEKADGVIDFSAPEYSMEVAQMAAELKKVHVCGTTGLTSEQQKKLAEYGKSAKIVWAPNMSVCVNLFMGMVEQAARALGEDFDIEIVEMHHRHKQDAPSGTALALGLSAARGRGLTLENAAVRGRDGITGERKKETIGFAAIRGGDVVGDHTVMFAGDGERLEFTHKASSRSIYVRGAIRAALWAWQQKPGLYSMKDVLGV